MSSFVIKSKLNIFVLFYYIVYIIKVKYFCIVLLYCLHLISSLLHTRSLLVPCTYVSIKSIDCILLSSFELKAILLSSSVKTLCLSLLNQCFVFNITLLFFYEFFKTIYINFIFSLSGLFYFQFEPLLNSFYNLEI